MNKKQLKYTWLVIAVIVSMIIIPPVGIVGSRSQFMGYNLIFASRYVIAFDRLSIQIFAVALVTGGLIYTFKNKRDKSDEG